MKRILLVIGLLSLMLPASLVQAPPTKAQDDDRDLREATFTAQEILRLAYERKFNAMYDRIHPDARAVVPRAAAVGVFEAAYEQTNAGEATVTGAKIVAWTWPVTGKSYDRAVAVGFTQPYTDANGQQQTLSDTMYLVKADGEWRWFFGSSKAFVDQAIAQYGPEKAPPLVEGDLVVNVLTDLDSFYADVVSYTDFKYTSPGYEYVRAGTSQNTACGPASPGFLAFYCPGDATIYVEQAFIDQLGKYGDFAPAFVLAHEFSHHVQTLVSFERVDYQEPTKWNQVWSIELELMADCMSGAWAQDVDVRGLLESDDVNEAEDLIVDMLGDPSFVDRYDPQAHGTADERSQAFLSGYEDGFLGCNITM